MDGAESGSAVGARGVAVVVLGAMAVRALREDSRPGSRLELTVGTSIQTRPSDCPLAAIVLKGYVAFIYTMKGLGKIYPPDSVVFQDIWLSFLYGAKIGVLGANGAGKSTLLKIMAGLDPDYVG